MHEFDEEIDALAAKILEYSLIRLKKDPPLDGPWTYDELYAEVGETITEGGLGGEKALDLFKHVLAQACISTDHPRNLAFIPSAPTESSNLFDLVVGASSLYGGSWMEGAGAVFAENQALRWLSDLAGFPATSGGVFVQGGTVGNLSALVAARHDARARYSEISKWVIACSDQAHSSIKSAASVMDVEVLNIKCDSNHRLQGAAVASEIDEFHRKNPTKRVFAVVATAGTTNLGIIDDLKGIGKAAKERDIWYHVDGAYGLAALASPKTKPLFSGVELADSFIVDPHKWLFAPFDACALIYRNPEIARAAHTQHAGYLEALENGEWNPSDYAIHLTRRVRGLPFWFSLAAHGTKKYAEAMDKTMDIARQSAELVKEHPSLELLMEPELSIVAFTRKGWSASDYKRWSDKLLNDQIGFVTPSTHDGKPILRFAIVNPWTSLTDIKVILATL
ncbi:MAG: aminotransferase class V-fold PLP-dependent enzyme [Candidatus Nanopelagicaceae bacterium]|nr:aminotransferase class V-fold PLP-dependent enzyme [Candidatus Nanopelagicaceae bacterium]